MYTWVRKYEYNCISSCLLTLTKRIEIERELICTNQKYKVSIIYIFLGLIRYRIRILSETSEILSNIIKYV